MSREFILVVVVIYFIALLVIAFYTSRGAGNESFFIGKKNSHWLLVAYGMIGTSLSGITFMSVPGKVMANHFFYLQIVIGYLIGYIVVATVLMPLYYKMNVTSIYTYLQSRFGKTAYKTGASFFILSRTFGAALRIYLVLYVLQKFLLDEMGINFFITTFVILLMILLYTFQGGVKTIVWTDTLQTTFMILALVVTIVLIKNELGFSFNGLMQSLNEGGYTQLFNLDFKSPAFFMKQIISGAFITIAMTGLDQEMMQKNISIRTLGKAQQNMFTFSGILLVVNLLFLILGGALYVYAAQKGITLSAQSDDTFPIVALQYLPPVAGLIFIIGLISALFPSADGAMTALTSSFCIDILNFNNRSEWSEEVKKRKRKIVHLTVAVIFFLIILLFKIINKTAVIDLVLEIAGYTYGPLLGLFAFGILTKKNPEPKFVPIICIIAPALTYLLKLYSPDIFSGYQIGFEILPINGLITFAGLFASSSRTST
ncbi:MAG TPA: sodium:solute symporter [Bacteroidia bacterium]|nr:sodium:solute symporter [Bacteroidia bacterium]